MGDARRRVVRADDSWRKVQHEADWCEYEWSGYGCQGSGAPRQSSKGWRRNSKRRQQWMMKTSDPSNKPDVDFDRCKAAPWKRKAGQDRFAERRRARHEEIDSSPNGKLLSGPVTFNLA